MSSYAAVLGSPISHSLSPAIHTRAYKLLSLDAQYSAIEVQKSDLKTFLSPERLRDPGCLGFSLTMPLKEEICSEEFSGLVAVDKLSNRIQSANTLYRTGNQWTATSTDVLGFEYLLGSRKLSQVSVLGAGGTTRAALAANQLRDAEITIFRRNASRDASLVKSFPELSINFRDWQDLEASTGSELLINTVPDAAIKDLQLNSLPLLVDAIYAPWEPSITKHQRASGREVYSGIDLLCAQAIFQISLMTKLHFDKEHMFQELRAEALANLK